MLEKNEMEKKYEGAIGQLIAFLDEIQPLKKGAKHYVYLWAAEDFGPRISEFGWADPTGGAAIMRADWDCGALILAAEEFLLMAACDWPEKDEELETAKERLRALYRS